LKRELKKMKSSLKAPGKTQKTSELNLSPIKGHDLIPPEIVIYLTGTCRRADCRHCIIKDNFSGEKISFTLLEKVFNEMNQLEIPFVSFTGGEPFEYEWGLENAIRLARKNNLFINQIITNASFAGNIDNAVSEIKKLKKSGFEAIKIKEKWLVPCLTISMDREHQRFIYPENVKNLIEAARTIFGEYLEITVNYTLFDETKEYALERYPWLRNIDVEFSRICYEGRAKNLKRKEMFEIEDGLKRWNSPCNPYSKSWPCVPAIFPNGEINFCCYFGLDGSLSLGNIRDTTIEHALNNINKSPVLISLYRYGPAKLYSDSKDNIKLYEKETYGKCGLCNLLLCALARKNS
jgi:MoaA/NifB/PqqE/SkfB family radical SAM enzyme